MADQAMARCNKCGSGLAPRSAARAALDLKGAEDPKAGASRCAARAALDLKGAEDPKAGAARSAARAALDLKGAEDPKAGASRCAARAALGLCITAKPSQAHGSPHPMSRQWSELRLNPSVRFSSPVNLEVPMATYNIHLLGLSEIEVATEPSG